MKLNKLLVAAIVVFGLISCGDEAQKKEEVTESSEINGDSANIKVYIIDTTLSSIKWTGSKPTEEHFGTLNLLPTIVELNGKQIVHGDIAVNMQSMTVSDIEDKESNAKLLGHLKNEDFFNVEKYPEAHLVVLESRVDPDQNIMMVDLIIKGIQTSVEIPYNIEYEEKQVVINGFCSFDRTNYDIKYKSKSFFSDLGDKFINDEIKLDFSIVLKEFNDN